MKILIVGGGIAGLTCAYRLEKFGFSPVLIEKSQTLRDEGYLIDFIGEGLQISQAMGIFQGLEILSENFQGVDFVNNGGRVVGGFDIHAMREYVRSRGHEYIAVTRGDLERALYTSLSESVEVRFGEHIASLVDGDDHVDVTFASGMLETYDIVIGADGIHSSTREMVRGDQEQFLVPFGSRLLITRLSGLGKKSAYHCRTKARLASKKMLMAIPTRDEDLLVIAGVETEESVETIRDRPIDFFREQFGSHDLGKGIVDALTPETFVFVDDIAQIRMDSWCRGRVALIGDAASCPTLLSGQGAHMAMTQGYVLAHQLSLHPEDAHAAFAGYEETLMEVVTDRMKRAKKLQGTIIPRTWLATWMSYVIFALMKYRWMMHIAFGPFTTPTIFDEGYPLAR